MEAPRKRPAFASSPHEREPERKRGRGQQKGHTSRTSKSSSRDSDNRLECETSTDAEISAGGTIGWLSKRGGTVAETLIPIVGNSVATLVAEFDADFRICDCIQDAYEPCKNRVHLSEDSRLRRGDPTMEAAANHHLKNAFIVDYNVWLLLGKFAEENRLDPKTGMVCCECYKRLNLDVEPDGPPTLCEVCNIWFIESTGKCRTGSHRLCSQCVLETKLIYCSRCGFECTQQSSCPCLYPTDFGGDVASLGPMHNSEIYDPLDEYDLPYT